MLRRNHLNWVMLSVFALLLALQPRVAAADEPTEFTLAQQGFGDQVLRGSTAGIDIFFPGPGRYRVGERNILTIVTSHAEILDPTISIATVFFNEVPLHSWFLTADLARIRDVPILVPRTLIRPDTNRVQVRYTLRLPGEACADIEHPALNATVHNRSRIQYDVQAQAPRNPLEAPDLARFPLTFLDPGTSQVNSVALVVPDSPADTDLQAALNIAGTLGRRSESRALQLQLLPVSAASRILSAGSVVVIGQPANNNLWDILVRQADRLPLPLLNRQNGQFRSFSGGPVAPSHGVLMDIQSPWNAEGRALLVTGGTPEAVLGASLALSTDTARRTLSGNAAIITEYVLRPSVSGTSASASAGAVFTLQDLGYNDTTVFGWGTHIVSIVFNSSGEVSKNGAARLVYGHTRVINPSLSSVAVSLNGIPLIDASLKDDVSDRAVLEVQLPGRSIKPGRNVLSVQFALTPRPTGSSPEGCPSVPPQLAWAVLHGDSHINLPPSTTSGARLSTFPFPFIKEGKSDALLVVLPDDVNDASHAAALAAELGQWVLFDLLDIPTTTASRLGPAERASKNLVLLGTSLTNPVIREVGQSLPLRLDASGRIVQSLGEPFAGTQDHSTLGVLEVVTSPFNSARAVMVVSGTSPDGVPLAIKALRQGGLQGNAVIVAPPAPGTTGVQIRSFDVPLEAPQQPAIVRTQEAVPATLSTIAALIAVTVIVFNGGRLYRLQHSGAPAQRPVAESEWSDWLEPPGSGEITRGT